jgi:2',3'-cyclic-nucleotide 2'-phosphodiesterase (5'-nucleotidase family)
MFRRRAVIVAGLVAASACRGSKPAPPRAPDAALAVAAHPAAAPPRLAPTAVLPATPLAGQPLTVLYSSNLLGEYDAQPLGGLPRRATLTAQLGAETALVQVDAGDTLLPSLAGLDPDRGEIERRAALLMTGLSRLHLDAMVPGETDLALSPRLLEQRARKAGLPLVAANLQLGGKPWLPPDRLVEARGLKVGIFGLVSLPPDALPAGMVATDPIAAARSRVQSLRARGARVVLGLLHAAGGAEEARRLAAAVAGIDVLVVGHDGATLDPPEVQGTTRIVEAHRRGIFLGRLELGVGEELQARQRILRLEPSVATEPAMKALVKSYVAESQRRQEKNLPTALAPAPRPPPEESWTYASTGACELCHKAATDQWRTTAHGSALDTLQSRGRGRDVYCYGCHMTAFAAPGGTKSIDTAITYYAGVGCESCHGPSVFHVRANKAEHTRRQVPESVCRECHRADQQPDTFNYAEALKLVLGPGHGDGGKGMR